MTRKMSAYRRDFDGTIHMLFLIKNEELLKTYNETWNKVSNSIKKDLIVILYTMKKIKISKN